MNKIVKPKKRIKVNTGIKPQTKKSKVKQQVKEK